MISSSGDSRSSSTSKRERSSSTPAGAIASRTRTRGPRLSASVVLILSFSGRAPPAPSREPRRASDRRPFRVDLERARRGGPALERRAELVEDELDRVERGCDVELVVPADVADPEDRVLQLPLSAGDRDAVALAERQRQFARVEPVGHAGGGDDGRTVLVGREELEPHLLDPRAAGSAEADMAVEGVLEAGLEQEAEGDVERDDQGHRGGEGAVPLLLGLPRPLPVEVEA